MPYPLLSAYREVHDVTTQADAPALIGPCGERLGQPAADGTDSALVQR
jgi:hypothetical protein